MACHRHHICKEEALRAAENICMRQKARFTKARREVFEVLWEGHRALTAAEIMEKIGNNQPPITYRALEFLKEYGLIHHIASLNAYVGCIHTTEEAHIGHLMVCTACRRVEELEQKKPFTALFEGAQQKGFNVQYTHVEMLGTCAQCAQN